MPKKNIVIKLFMYTFVKPITSDGPLITGEHIFPRPTPWAVAWEASFLWLLGRTPYKMAFIPKKYKLHTYDVAQENGFVVIFEGETPVRSFEMFEISWAILLDYCVQSFLYGLFQRFWNWRWDERGKMTREELQVKLERLEQQMETRSQRRSHMVNIEEE